MKKAAISFFLLFSAHLFAQSNQSSSGQTQSGPDKFWTFGWDFGLLGFSPSHTDYISGTDFFTRTKNSGIGVVTDVDGKRHFSLSSNTSIGVNAGFMFRDGKTRD